MRCVRLLAVNLKLLTSYHYRLTGCRTRHRKCGLCRTQSYFAPPPNSGSVVCPAAPALCLLVLAASPVSSCPYCPEPIVDLRSKAFICSGPGKVHSPLACAQHDTNEHRHGCAHLFPNRRKLRSHSKCGTLSSRPVSDVRTSPFRFHNLTSVIYLLPARSVLRLVPTCARRPEPTLERIFSRNQRPTPRRPPLHLQESTWANTTVHYRIASLSPMKSTSTNVAPRPFSPRYPWVSWSLQLDSSGLVGLLWTHRWQPPLVTSAFHGPEAVLSKR